METNKMEPIKTLNQDTYGPSYKAEEAELLHMLKKALNSKDSDHVKYVKSKLAAVRAVRGLSDPRIKHKPICEITSCDLRVSTEHGRPKPFCKDHIQKNPYVQDLMVRITNLNDRSDRQEAKMAFKAMEEEYENGTRPDSNTGMSTL